MFKFTASRHKSTIQVASAKLKDKYSITSIELVRNSKNQYLIHKIDFADNLVVKTNSYQKEMIDFVDSIVKRVNFHVVENNIYTFIPEGFGEGSGINAHSINNSAINNEGIDEETPTTINGMSITDSEYEHVYKNSLEPVDFTDSTQFEATINRTHIAGLLETLMTDVTKEVSDILVLEDFAYVSTLNPILNRGTINSRILNIRVRNITEGLNPPSQFGLKETISLGLTKEASLQVKDYVSLSFNQLLLDSLGLQDYINLIFNPQLLETLEVKDYINLGFNRTLLDSLELKDYAALAINIQGAIKGKPSTLNRGSINSQKLNTEIVTRFPNILELRDYIDLGFNKELLNEVELRDYAGLVFKEQLLDNVSFIDSVRLGFNQQFLDNLELKDSVSLVFNQQFLDNTELKDYISLRFSTQALDDMQLTDSVRLGFNQQLSDGTELRDYTNLRSNIKPSEELELTDFASITVISSPAPVVSSINTHSINNVAINNASTQSNTSSEEVEAL